MSQTSSDTASIILKGFSTFIYNYYLLYDTMEGNVKNCAKKYEDAAGTQIEREAHQHIRSNIDSPSCVGLRINTILQSFPSILKF